jgi:hypothetical protein
MYAYAPNILLLKKQYPTKGIVTINLPKTKTSLVSPLINRKAKKGIQINLTRNFAYSINPPPTK